MCKWKLDYQRTVFSLESGIMKMFEYATVSYQVSCLFYMPYKQRLLQKYVTAAVIVWEGTKTSLKIQSQFGYFLISAATAF